jgi:hypothetical protein
MDVTLVIFMFSTAAQHVVEKEKDIKRAMDFLHECDLLKIEDILPFFPDFVTIDHFKVSLLSRFFCLSTICLLGCHLHITATV